MDLEPDEREADYSLYRDELMTAFINLCLIKPIHSRILELLYESLTFVQTVKPKLRQAEVPLNMVFNL